MLESSGGGTNVALTGSPGALWRDEGRRCLRTQLAIPFVLPSVVPESEHCYDGEEIKTVNRNRYRVAKMIPVQCKMARVALGLGVRELAALAKVSTDTISRFERGEELKERTVDAIRAALERGGVEFTNGGQPGVSMSARILELRSRNYELDRRIDQQKTRASKAVLAKLERIAMDSELLGLETEDALIRRYENLRRRAWFLIESGVSTESDFAANF